MENTGGKSEQIIETIIGCGLFQAIMYVSVNLLIRSGIAFTVMFMAFGNYNPGWRCLDHNITMSDVMAITNTTRWNVMPIGLSENESRVERIEYTKDGCTEFDYCNAIEFNPEASTIVSQWGLVCDKSWIPALIISLQMAGLGVGSCIGGFIGDYFGRKKTIYISQIFTTVFNIITAFSSSWQMFAAMRFFLGFSISFSIIASLVYITEFVTKKWRSVLLCLPTFPFLVVCFAVTCLLLKDWRLVHITTAVVSAIGLVPALWVPESLRWLEVNERKEQFEDVAQRIARRNGKKLPPFEEIAAVNLETTVDGRAKSNIFRDTLQLFNKEYRTSSIIVFAHHLSVSLIYYALGFGVKALSGSIYINIIIFFGTECVFDSLTMNVPNLLGRRKAGFLYSGISGICLLTAACLDRMATGNTKTIGITAFVATGRITASCFWGILQVLVGEIYPTVLRGVATSYGFTGARVGGILAPILIPRDASTIFICYTVMGAMGIICAATMLLLPETKGTTLKQTFEEGNTVMTVSVKPSTSNKMSPSVRVLDQF